MLVESLDDMTREVSHLLQDAGARSELGANAQDYARQFSWAGTVESWERLLVHVASKKAPVAMTDAQSLGV